MTLDNDAILIEQLKDFEKLSVKAISPSLEEYLKLISKTGDTCCNWAVVKPLLVYKLNRVLDIFYETVVENGDVHVPTAEDFQATKDRLTNLLQGFFRAPFTIQRIMELLLEPNLYYKRFDKFARGLEKVLSVVTTVDPYPNKAPSSLLPNTVLNGNGDMRVLDENKKSNREEDDEVEERSPKRMKLMNGEAEDCHKENTEPNHDDKSDHAHPTRESSVCAAAESTTGLTTQDTPTDDTESNEATPSVVASENSKEESESQVVSPDSTTIEVSQKIPDVPEASVAGPDTTAASEENEVSTTQKEHIPKTSLSAILSDSIADESPNCGT